MKNKGLSAMMIIFFVMTLTTCRAMAAADTTAPVITHVPVQTAASGSPLQVSARVSDDQRVNRVTLYIRSTGTASYYALPAQGQADGTYQATIPAMFTGAGALEYYFEAVDDAGNIATYPLVGAATRPIKVTLARDTSAPRVMLQSPLGMVGQSAFVLLVTFSDEANNIDAKSVSMSFNGVDLTKQARISTRSLSLRIEPSQIKSRNEVMVRVKDLAGNETEQVFYITQYPKITGSFNTDFSYDKGKSSLASSLTAGIGWGPLQYQASLRSDDPFFTRKSGPAKNKHTLSFTTGMLKASVFDVQTTVSPVAASGVAHNGINLELKLGPLESVWGYGQVKAPVSGESYARRFLATKQGLKLGGLYTNLSFSEFIDEQPPTGFVAPTINPEQNYVLGLEGGMALGPISLSTDLAATAYMSNARGNLWDNLDSLPDKFMNMNLAITKQQLKSMPEAVKYLFPLPFDKTNVLASLEQYLHAADIGGKISMKTRLPFSNLDTSYYRYGPDFKTLGGSARQNAQGYNASLSSDTMFGVLSLSGNYEQYHDNLQSIFDLAFRVVPSGPTTRYTTVGSKLNLATSLAKVELSYSASEDGDAAGTVATNQSDTYELKLSGMDWVLGPLQGGLSTGYSTTQSQQYTTEGAPLGTPKQTQKVDASQSIRLGGWQGNVGYSQKMESDQSSFSLSPSLSVGSSWRIGDVSMLGIPLNQLKIDANASMNQTNSATQNNKQKSFGLQMGINPSKASNLSLKYGLSITGGSGAQGKATHDNSVQVKYRVSF